MASSFTPGPLLGQMFPLAGGVQVRLRLAHFSDRSAIASLLAHASGEAQIDPAQADGLVQFDPRRRYVLCACALIDSTERMVGVGAIDLERPPAAEPDLMVVDPQLLGRDGSEVAEALAGLLWGALVGAAHAVARRAA